MNPVFLTAIGVGGATVFGGIIGFIIKRIPKRFSELTLSFAAGIMLAAAIWGLIIPSLGEGTLKETAVSVAGIVLGALFVSACERLVPKLHFVADGDCDGEELDSVLLLVLAIAIHNLPEGIAAGVSLGSGDVSGALSVAGGIALQNIPEGMVVVPPMLAVGISRRRTFFLALFTGLSEVAGTFLGYQAVTFFSWLLPVALAFAGGAMLYVIADEMIPRAREEGKVATYILLLGFCSMMLMNCLL